MSSMNVVLVFIEVAQGLFFFLFISNSYWGGLLWKFNLSMTESCLYDISMTYMKTCFYDFKVIVEKAERSDIPNIDKKKWG